MTYFGGYYVAPPTHALYFATPVTVHPVAPPQPPSYGAMAAGQPSNNAHADPRTQAMSHAYSHTHGRHFAEPDLEPPGGERALHGISTVSGNHYPPEGAPWRAQGPQSLLRPDAQVFVPQGTAHIAPHASTAGQHAYTYPDLPRQQSCEGIHQQATQQSPWAEAQAYVYGIPHYQRERDASSGSQSSIRGPSLAAMRLRTAARHQALDSIANQLRYISVFELCASSTETWLRS